MGSCRTSPRSIATPSRASRPNPPTTSTCRPTAASPATACSPSASPPPPPPGTAPARHPGKAVTPESGNHIGVQDHGRVGGVRVLALRSPDATASEHRDGLDYWPKSGGLCVRDFPSLARLRLGYAAGRVRLET